MNQQNLMNTKQDNHSTCESVLKLKDYIGHHVVGQGGLISRLLIALLADGHLLVEGAPGLAKTKVVKHLAEAIEGRFHRIQFTPDLLPADVTGTDIYRPSDGSFVFQQGPIFHNLVLADEINRAPAKVQSALLEAMAERQVTIGSTTYALPDLFLVMATQNHIEQEGTYPLPEAQLDRFHLYVRIDYPDSSAEKQILALARDEFLTNKQSQVALTAPKISQATLLQARREVATVHISSCMEEYVVELVMATRQPQKYDAKLAHWISSGASPRGTIALERCAKAHAWLNGRDYVSPSDVQALCVEVLAHRLVLTFTAQAEGKTPQDVMTHILDLVAVP